MLGWNDGSGQELFTMEELIQKFSIDRVHKGGAKFDFEKPNGSIMNGSKNYRPAITWPG